jgi:hypothetical protein
MAVYPYVRGELETLQRVLAGASLARYGDGEFKHCANKRNVSQEYDPRLSARLRDILRESGTCMVGIPNLNTDALARMSDDKRAFWQPYGQSAANFLEPGRSYASAFLSRPDSAPWIDTAEYWQLVESLWRNKDVTLVRGSDKGLKPEDLTGAGTVTEVVCPRQHAFAEYDNILAHIGKPARVILCLGPTATVLAVDLAERGVHAIDLGHLALFWRKHRRGEAMTLTKDDKSHDKVPA